MRIMIIAMTAGLLVLPTAAPAFACGNVGAAHTASTDLSAAKKKPMQKAARKTKEKVEYMRAVPAN